MRNLLLFEKLCCELCFGDRHIPAWKNPPDLLSCQAATLPAITEIRVVQSVLPRVMLGREERTKEAESFIFFACLGNEILLLNFSLLFLLLFFFFFCNGYHLRGSQNCISKIYDSVANMCICINSVQGQYLVAEKLMLWCSF